MNREILFKAKRTDNGEWVEGFYFERAGMHFIIDIGNTHIHTTYLKEDIFDFDLRAFMVDRKTLCQYTGLTDKNGNKIWENDVVKKHFYTDYDAFANSEEYVGVVKFIDCAWVVETVREKNKCIRPIFEAMAYSQDVKYFEVIGNIFDNPELLGGGDNG